MPHTHTQYEPLMSVNMHKILTRQFLSPLSCSASLVTIRHHPIAYEVNAMKPYMGTYLANPRAKQDHNDVLEERKGFLQRTGCEAWAGPTMAGKAKPPSPVHKQGRRNPGEIQRGSVEPCPLSTESPRSQRRRHDKNTKEGSWKTTLFPRTTC